MLTRPSSANCKKRSTFIMLVFTCTRSPFASFICLCLKSLNLMYVIAVYGIVYI